MSKKNVLISLVLVSVVLILSGGARAALILHLKVPESSGSTTVNSGTSGGTGTLGSGVTFVTDEPTTVFDPTGYSLNFDGSANSRVAFGTDFAGLNEYQNRIVVAAWVKIDDFSHDHNLVMASSASTGLPEGFAFYVKSNLRLGVIFRPASQDTQYAESGLALVKDNEWTHVAAKIDIVADTLSLYINGEKLYVKPVPGANQIKMTSATQLTLNRTPGSDLNLLDGRLDDVRIYTNDMSDDDIAALVPEPATLLLLLSGLMFARRNR